MKNGRLVMTFMAAASLLTFALPMDSMAVTGSMEGPPAGSWVLTLVKPYNNTPYIMPYNGNNYSVQFTAAKCTYTITNPPSPPITGFMDYAPGVVTKINGVIVNGNTQPIPSSTSQDVLTQLGYSTAKGIANGCTADCNQALAAATKEYYFPSTAYALTYCSPPANLDFWYWLPVAFPSAS